jgi:small-conductance mechanosensitive channel
MMVTLKSYIGDSILAQWLALGVISLVISSFIKLFLGILISQLQKMAEKTQVIWDDLVVGALERVKHWVLTLGVFYLVARSYLQSTVLEKPFQLLVVASIVAQILIWGQYLLKYWRAHILDRRVLENPSAAAALGLLYRCVQVSFATLVVLMGLSNIGVDIGALLAGLGVGGIAVALAAQNILGDLLASLSIILDKPFVIGDLVVTGDIRGTIEYIGIKTTRLRSVSGEQIILSNKSLLESQVKNFQRMAQRRIVKTFGVVYNTPLETLERIPQWIKEIVEKNHSSRFESCQLENFGSSSLDFELSFHVPQPDCSAYKGIQEQILLDILKKFQEEKVEFAYPTQSVLMDRVSKPKSPAQCLSRST